MSVFLNPKCPNDAIDRPHRDCLHIGLVNNMADAAMESTERQFFTLLEAAAGDTLVCLTLYALPGVERNVEGQRRVNRYYFDTEQLWELPPNQYPDGLIVTGREPLTADLREEAYWPGFERLLMWTRTHGRSAVWSCLAAHAAVLALDGIERVRSRQKHFGVFACQRAAPHMLLAGAPPTLHIPHSRFNGLAAGELTARGYRVLTRNGDCGVDTFVKQNAALFVFFQGHPEYEAETLMREYRRDVGRYLRHEMETYPSLPVGYFPEDTERTLRGIEAEARKSRREKLLGEVSAAIHCDRVRNTWRGAAAVIYRNWLKHLRAQRADLLELVHEPAGRRNADITIPVLG